VPSASKPKVNDTVQTELGHPVSWLAIYYLCGRRDFIVNHSRSILI
jgi:hypothetical protein